MPSCEAPNCFNRSSRRSQRQEEIEKHTKITFHRFPKLENRRLQWANALELELTTLSKNAYICSLHFPEESFDRTSLACVRLRDHAVPCLKTIKQEEECEVNVLEQHCVTAMCDESNVYPTLSDASTQTLTYLDEAVTLEPTNARETAISSWDTPGKMLLRKALQNEKETSRKLIQALKKINRRQKKKIAELQSIVHKLNLKVRKLV